MAGGGKVCLLTRYLGLNGGLEKLAVEGRLRRGGQKRQKHADGEQRGAESHLPRLANSRIEIIESTRREGRLPD